MTTTTQKPSVGEYIDQLALWYKLEAGGAILASYLANMYGDSRQGAIFSLIASLEERTANWIENILISHNREPSIPSDLDSLMSERAQDIVSKKWEDIIPDLLNEFQEWVGKLHESKQNVPEEFSKIFEHLLHHEEVLAEFASLEAAGEHRRSTDGIRLLLNTYFEA